MWLWIHRIEAWVQIRASPLPVKFGRAAGASRPPFPHLGEGRTVAPRPVSRCTEHSAGQSTPRGAEPPL